MPAATPTRVFALALLAWAAAAAGAAGAAASPADDELARRTYANAEQLLREGKIEQALKDFEQVSTAYPQSDMADDALYRMGSHYYPVEGFETLGTAGREAIARAKEIFSRINSRYPREDHAPRALYKLGLIALDPSNPQRSLDEAYASFSGVVNIYPGSDVVDRALFGAGYADFLAGRLDKAITSFEAAAERFPRGTAAQESRYHMGLAHARLGSAIRALEEFQNVRDVDPNGRLARRALDRLTQVHKLKVLPGLGVKPLFVLDERYAPALDPNTVKGEVSLAVDQDNVLRLLDSRTGSIVRLARDGRLQSTGQPLPGAVSVAVDPAGVELAAAGDRIRSGMELVIPSRQEGSGARPYEKITAVARVGTHEAALLDEGRNEILQYSGDPARLKLLYRDPSGRARLSGLAAGAEGKLYSIDRRGRKILEIPAGPAVQQGGAVREVPLPAEADRLLQEPAALAADDLGTLYVLDRRSRAVVVMTSDGRMLEAIEPKPGPSEMGYPAALAVGPGAEIYVYDAKRRTILRFR
ncbi:MAG TPA: tetratricopeptide repeat protein [Candidatus Polarisedimenticolia bacterium]|nr:tetratricopeptide repeat protein [Candidatus Polarisedimenticolia bacterium]